MFVPQIRDSLPNLKAIVQYKGKLSEEYKDVYDVGHVTGHTCHMTLSHDFLTCSGSSS